MGDRLWLHRCDNPRCIKPGHLFLGSLADNSVDCARKKRSGNQKLGVGDAIAIREAADSGEKTKSIMARFGVSRSQVRKLAMRKFAWTHLKDGA